MGATGFVPLTAPQIIPHMKLNYRKQGIGEIKKALLRLNDPMDRDMPIEVMLQSLEEVQTSLLASLEENRELTEVNLIDHALTKLSETGGFIQRRWKSGIAAWSLINTSGKTFCTVIVGEYKRMFKEGLVTTIHQEQYGTAFHAEETMSDDEYLTETIVKYAERVSQVESRVRELEG